MVGNFTLRYVHAKTPGYEWDDRVAVTCVSPVGLNEDPCIRAVRDGAVEG